MNQSEYYEYSRNALFNKTGLLSKENIKYVVTFNPNLHIPNYDEEAMNFYGFTTIKKWVVDFHDNSDFKVMEGILMVRNSDKEKFIKIANELL